MRKFWPGKEENWSMYRYVANWINKMIQTEKKESEPISHVLTSTFQIVSHFPEQINKLFLDIDIW